MKEIMITGVMPERMNSAQLRDEIAAKLQVAPEEVLLTIMQGGESRSMSRVGKEPSVETKAIEPAVIVRAPHGSHHDIERVLAAHAPEKDDHEAAAAAGEERLNEQVLSSRAYQDLLGRVEALERKKA